MLLVTVRSLHGLARADAADTNRFGDRLLRCPACAFGEEPVEVGWGKAVVQQYMQAFVGRGLGKFTLEARGSNARVGIALEARAAAELFSNRGRERHVLDRDRCVSAGRIRFPQELEGNAAGIAGLVERLDCQQITDQIEEQIRRRRVVRPRAARQRLANEGDRASRFTALVLDFRELD